MNTFKDAFMGRRHVFLVAIHVTPDENAAFHDVEIARGEGADGIILIKDYNTLATDTDVLAAYDYERDRYPRWWIGVNLLDHVGEEAVMATREGTSGLWIDRCDIKEEAAGYLKTTHLEHIRRKQEVFRHRTALLASIAFKYQTPVKNPAYVARLAESHTDVLVTSGNATGVPADFDKIQRMCAAVNKPLGLASGVSVENVERYQDIGVYVFIVNTSISDPETGRLDAGKVHALRKLIPR